MVIEAFRCFLLFSTVKECEKVLKNFEITGILMVVAGFVICNCFS